MGPGSIGSGSMGPGQWVLKSGEFDEFKNLFTSIQASEDFQTWLKSQSEGGNQAARGNGSGNGDSNSSTATVPALTEGNKKLFDINSIKKKLEKFPDVLHLSESQRFLQPLGPTDCLFPEISQVQPVSDRGINTTTIAQNLHGTQDADDEFDNFPWDQLM